MNSEEGIAATELVLVTPLLFALLIFVVFAGRSAGAAHDVTQAAADAARAASLRATPAAAIADARATVDANLTASGTTCADTSVAVDTSRMTPGGVVTVEIDCVVSYADLSTVALPGLKVFSARGVEVIDTYRSIP